MRISIILIFALFHCLINGQYVIFKFGTKAITMPSNLAQGYLKVAKYNILDKSQHFQLLSIPSLGSGYFVVSRSNPNYVFDVSNSIANEGVRIVSYLRKTTASSSANQRFYYNGTTLNSVMSSGAFSIGISSTDLVQLYSRHSNRTLFVATTAPGEATITFTPNTFDIRVTILQAPSSEPNATFVVPAGITPITRSFIIGTVLTAHNSTGGLLYPVPRTVTQSETFTFNYPPPPEEPITDVSSCIYYQNLLTGYYWQIRDLRQTIKAGTTTYYIDGCGHPNCYNDWGFTAVCSNHDPVLAKIDNAKFSTINADKIMLNLTGGNIDDLSCSSTVTIIYTCKDVYEPGKLVSVVNCHHTFDVTVDRYSCSYVGF